MTKRRRFSGDLKAKVADQRQLRLPGSVTFSMSQCDHKREHPRSRRPISSRFIVRKHIH